MDPRKKMKSKFQLFFEINVSKRNIFVQIFPFASLIFWIDINLLLSFLIKTSLTFGLMNNQIKALSVHHRK